MPQKQWSDKRERPYQHIKDSERKQGQNEDRAEEIAARTVNKMRAQHGEAQNSNSATTQDMAPSLRGGQRSHRGVQGPAKAQLYADARRRNISGRSKMNKSELEDALKQ